MRTGKMKKRRKELREMKKEMEKIPPINTPPQLTGLKMAVSTLW